MTDAHSQKMTVRYVLSFPEHEPRESDPHYRAFEDVRRRMKRAGLLKCVVCGSEENVQLHHSTVEFAFANAVDVGRLNVLLGFHLDDAGFQEWIESPGNLEPLCREHHIGHEAVHALPEPVWNAVRLAKPGVTVAEVTH